MPAAKLMLGIDLRVVSVKAVEVEFGKAGFSVISSGLTEAPYDLLDKHPALEEAKTQALKKLIQTNKVKAREAVVVVGGPETLVKLVTLTRLPQPEIAPAIKWKLAEEISFPVEEAILDYYPIPGQESTSEKVKYAAACISRNLYLETEQVISRAGLKLSGIVVLPDALAELYRSRLTGTSQKTVAIVYMGKRTTNISIFRGGNFAFNRELPMGGQNITLAMAGILVSAEGKVEISPEQAEQIKVEHGILPSPEEGSKLENIPLSQLHAMVRPELEKIQGEIARTLEYFRGQEGEVGVEEIILTGGSSQTRRLPEFLSQGLGIAVTTAEPLPQFNPRLSGALGAALTEGKKINLLPEEVKFRWQKNALKALESRKLFLLAGGALLLIYLFFWMRIFFLDREIEYLSSKIKDYKPQLERMAEIGRKTSAIKSYEGQGAKIPRVFAEISHLVPESVTLKNIKVSADGLRFTGVVFEKGEAAGNNLSRFIAALAGSAFFRDVQLSQANRNSNYVVEAFNFEINAKLK